jgi:hypothetical protein
LAYFIFFRATIMVAHEAGKVSEDSMLRKALLAILILASVVLVSCTNSEQVARERKKQAVLQELDRKNAEEAATVVGVASKEDRAKQMQRDLDAENAIANLGSPDREVLNEAIQKIQYYRACQAVPQLMDLLKASPDDYIAGISAQTIAVCHQRSTFDTIVDQFLRRNDTPSMIDAIGKIDSSDPRVIKKIKKLIAEPNQDEYVPVTALRVKQQLEMALHRPL